VVDLELNGLTVARAAHAFRARALSPLELAEAYLRRIERLNPRLNAYITVTAERARADARQASEELAAHKTRGPLHGIPVALKDLYETAGIRTTGGAKIHADWMPAEDCTVARRLRDAGTTLLGKLNTHEYAYGVTTANPHFGPTRNPWDPERIPGGSSGGSGAAIAAGLATATTGTDTGGSIRMPASVCGVVGLKPTYGRVSKAGVLPLSYLFDHAGPITRSVEDAALLLNAIAGYDPRSETVRTPVPDHRGAAREAARPAHRRAAALASAATTRSPPPWQAIADCAGSADGRDVDVPNVEAGLAATLGLSPRRRRSAQALRTRPADFGADVLALLTAPTPDAMAVMASLRARDGLSAAMRVVLESVDLLVTPTTPIVAAKIGQETVRFGGVEDTVLNAMIRCTAPFNATGLPALSLPCGFTRAGLPVGLQLVGRPFDEVTVVRAGHAYEQATGWHERRAPLGA
jgi:aspartyl-tRNA(Asn)/glutamyl-tRNA(Gln) amidotransferase subunit A